MSTLKSLGVSCNMSQNYDIVETTVRACHENIRLAIANELDRARSMLEFGANDNSVLDSSSGTSGDGGKLSCVGASSS